VPACLGWPSSRRSRAAEDIDDAISWLCSEARFVAGIAGDRVRHEGHLVSPAAIGRSGRLAALHGLEQRVLRRRGRHDLEPLQFSTDTGDITVYLIERLQAYLDSTPVS
jgi:hypothetical protein